MKDRRQHTGPRRWILIAAKVDGELKLVRWEMNGLHIYGIYSIPDGERRWAYPDVLQEQAGVDKNRAFDQIGMDDAIKNFKAKNPDWNSGSDRAIAEKLVNVEIKDPEASNYVGAPTTTVTVTKDGIKWANKGACK